MTLPGDIRQVSDTFPDRQEFRAIVAALVLAGLAGRTPTREYPSTTGEFATHALELTDALIAKLERST